MTFDPNDLRAIEAALQDERNPDNEIARAVLERVQACADHIAERIAELGEQPAELTVDEPATVLDAVAWRLAADSWSRETGQELRIVLGR
jgi:hypothetical protein